MNLGINLADYQYGALDNQVLFDTTSEQGFSDLSKALEARSITGRETTNLQTASGAPLKVESLEKNLKLITFREQDIRLFRDMPNSPAYNTVEEFAQLRDYGADRGGFTNEGELPEEEDSVYVRRAELVKFLGVTKSVTHQMQLVNTIVGPIVQREIKNGTLWILRKVDKAMTTGNASLISQEFNGLYTQHSNNDDFASFSDYMNSEVVIDLRGRSLTQMDVENGAQVIINNYGVATRLYAPPQVLAGFAMDYYTKQRILLGSAANTNFVGGAAPKTVSTTVGEIELIHDIFMRKASGRLTTAAATSLKAPAAPVVGTGVGGNAAGAVTDTSTKFALPSFQSTDGSGDYKYAVSSINRYGESSITSLGNAITVSASQSVDLSFIDGGGANPASGYVIYRTNKNDASGTPMYYPIFTVSAAQVSAGFDGGAAAIVRDRNRFLTNTEQAFTAQFDEEVLMWKQLAPLMKMDLARVSPAYRFMVLLYGTPQMYAPRKFVRYVNIGPYVLAA